MLGERTEGSEYKNGFSIDLTPSQERLISYLSSTGLRCVSVEELYGPVYGSNICYTPNHITNLVSRINSSEITEILCVRNYGYFLHDQLPHMVAFESEELFNPESAPISPADIGVIYGVQEENLPLFIIYEAIYYSGSKIITTDEIRKKLSEKGINVCNSTIRKYIRNIKKRFGKNLIINIHNRGYIVPNLEFMKSLAEQDELSSNIF